MMKAQKFMIAFIKLLITTPLMWAACAFLAGLVILRRHGGSRQAQRGWCCIIAGTAFLLILSFPPVANLLVYSLEHQYPPAAKETLKSLDVMVVLGGGVHPASGLRISAQPAGATYARLIQGVKLFEQSAARTLVLSGAADEPKGVVTNAEAMKALALKLGVAEQRIIIEDHSYNTAEHALEFNKIFKDEPKFRVGVVTSALHMPRSMQIFRKRLSGRALFPLPVDYQYNLPDYRLRNLIPSADALSMSTAALHEWIGMAWYKVRY